MYCAKWYQLANELINNPSINQQDNLQYDRGTESIPHYPLPDLEQCGSVKETILGDGPTDGATDGLTDLKQ